MSGPAGRIEDFFRTRYGREAVYLPSGRMAIYLALTEYLRPKDRLLLSPVNDDVVFFTVLAAGLRPVLGPVDPATGNLDPKGIPEDTWRSVRGVLTTNLYGIPDRMDLLAAACRRHGAVLIEDACQALDSTWDGTRIGSHAEVAAFSLTKHVEGTGGVLAVSDPVRADSLRRRARGEIRTPGLGGDLARRAREWLRAWDGGDGLAAALRRFSRRLAPRRPERPGHRMLLKPEALAAGLGEGGGLDRLDPWVRVDLHSYRQEPLPARVEATRIELERFEANRKARLEGTRKLRTLGLTPADVHVPVDEALFRFPLFVRDREASLARLAREDFVVDYVYDPPLDRYAGERFADAIASSPRAIRWSRDVLPVDPLRADAFLAIVKRVVPLHPAPVPAAIA